MKTPITGMIYANRVGDGSDIFTHSHIILPPKRDTKTAQGQPPKYKGTKQIAAKVNAVIARTPTLFQIGVFEFTSAIRP